VRCLSLSCVQLSSLCTKTTSSSKNELGESYALPLPLSPGKYLVAKVYNHVLRRMLCFSTSLLCTKLLCQRHSCSAQNLFLKNKIKRTVVRKMWRDVRALENKKLKCTTQRRMVACSPSLFLSLSRFGKSDTQVSSRRRSRTENSTLTCMEYLRWAGRHEHEAHGRSCEPVKLV
jgi:hypothetical protein